VLHRRPARNARCDSWRTQRWPARVIECGPGLCPLLRLSRPVRQGAPVRQPSTAAAEAVERQLAQRAKLDNAHYQDRRIS